MEGIGVQPLKAGLLIRPGRLGGETLSLRGIVVADGMDRKRILPFIEKSLMDRGGRAV